MGNLVAADITTTMLHQRRNNGRSYFSVKLVFGDGSKTYPSGGVPVTSKTFGMPVIAESVSFYDVGGSGFIWQYDKVNSKIRCLESRNLDWASLAGVTSSWTANTTVSSQYKMNGDTADVQVKLALAGAPTSAALTVTLPAALTVDTTKMASSLADACRVGIGSGSHGAAFESFQVQWNVTAPQQFDIYFYSSVSTAAMTAVNATAPITWANADEVNLRFNVPVTGFGGSQLNGLFEPAAVAIAAQTLKCEVIGW